MKGDLEIPKLDISLQNNLVVVWPLEMYPVREAPMNSAGLGILLSLLGISCSLTKTEFPGSEWTGTFLPEQHLHSVRAWAMSIKDFQHQTCLNLLHFPSRHLHLPILEQRFKLLKNSGVHFIHPTSLLEKQTHSSSLLYTASWEL